MILMLSYLLNWVRNRQRARIREIFRYWDGQKERAIDPFVAWKAIQDDPEYLSRKHDAAIDRGDLEAQGIAVACVQKAFHVKPLADGGLTHAEALGLLLAFYVYLDALKKNTEPPVTSPQPTA